MFIKVLYYKYIPVSCHMQLLMIDASYCILYCCILLMFLWYQFRDVWCDV
jgi:hypothetical protein